MSDPIEETTESDVQALLNPVEARVLGALMEKQLATPDQYPLTLSSLVAACNQKSNRDPVMQLATDAVEATLSGLRRVQKLAVLVHEAGARVPKFRQELTQVYGLNEVEQAVMAELMLRGPQTLAELRARVPRMVPAMGEDAVEAALAALEEVRGQAFVCKLPRAHGRRESRYAQQLCGPVTVEAEMAGAVVIEAPKPLEVSRLEALEAEVETLRGALAELQASFEAFRQAFEA